MEWLSGDATDAGTVSALVNKADAVVHAVGLLFDVNSVPKLKRLTPCRDDLKLAQA